jgi:hypothetical protein
MNRCDHSFMHAALFWGSVLAQAIICVSCIHAPAYSHTPRYSSTTTATARVSPSKPSAFVQAHLLWAQTRVMQLQLRGSVCDRRRCEKANVATQLSPSDNHARMALILVGSPVEGKQELGRALARRLDVNFVNGMELSSDEEVDALCGLCQDPSANLTRSASNRINLRSRTLAAVITSSAAGEEAYREADTPLLQALARAKEQGHLILKVQRIHSAANATRTSASSGYNRDMCTHRFCWLEDAHPTSSWSTAGTQCTCFTGTKVQILTQQALQVTRMVKRSQDHRTRARGGRCAAGSWPWTISSI